MMWITLTPNTDPKTVQSELTRLGLWTRSYQAPNGRTGIEIASYSRAVDARTLEVIPGVEAVFTNPSPHPKVDLQARQPLKIAGATIGNGDPILMAGPCSVESEEQIHKAAAFVARSGATLLRGGAFKPRSSPYSFCGVGPEALDWLTEAATTHGLGIVTEVLSEQDVDAVAQVADLIQVGARNMQNFALLREIGRAGLPVLLKRSMSATIEEWLLAGEHVLAGGAPRVIFCERGIQSFDASTRNLLDIAAIALMKHVYGQLVIADPSHGTGRRDLIPALSRAAIAAGADGLLIEAHPHAQSARSDGPQALNPEELQQLAPLFAKSQPELEKVSSR